MQMWLAVLHGASCRQVPKLRCYLQTKWHWRPYRRHSRSNRRTMVQTDMEAMDRQGLRLRQATATAQYVRPVDQAPSQATKKPATAQITTPQKTTFSAILTTFVKKRTSFSICLLIEYTPCPCLGSSCRFLTYCGSEPCNISNT